MGEWGSEGLQVHDWGERGYRYVMGEWGSGRVRVLQIHVGGVRVLQIHDGGSGGL